jgi:hypothetical protein
MEPPSEVQEMAGEGPTKPSIKVFSTQRLKQRLIAQTYDFLFAVLVLLTVTGGCVLSFFYCKPCLLGIIGLSFCLCPWVPYLNIPLWIAILMLIHWGYQLVTEKHKLVLEME